MHDLNDLAIFAAVVERGGFTTAASALGVAKSHVSQRIARLEQRLGVRLIQRTTRKQHVTELGGRYYAHCRQMLLEAELAQRVVESAQSAPGGELRVACPTLFSELILGPIVSDFLAAHPHPRLHLDAFNRPVDVIEEGYDLAFRIRTQIEDSSLVVRSFGFGHQSLVASPSLLKTYIEPRRPEQLRELPSIDSAMGNDNGRHQWRLRKGRGAERLVEIRPRLVSDDMLTLKHAALQGVGVALLPKFLCVSELARGRLRQVLPGWEPPAGNVHAVYASRRGLLPVMRSFLDYVAPRIESRLTELDSAPRGKGRQEPGR